MPLLPFGPDIWIAEGPVVMGAAGFHFPTRMAVIRLADGGLLLWSPVVMTNDLRHEVAALGPVRHLIGPNSLHHLFLADWKAAFPAALLHAAPGLREKRPDLQFDSDLGLLPHPGWAGEVDQVPIGGNRITTEVVFFHRASGTVLFTDLLQGLPGGWFRGWRALVARLDLMTGAEAAVPRKFRLAFTDRVAARKGLKTVLGWPAQRVLMAHGTPITIDAPDFLRRAFAWAKVPTSE